jgi:hypothetical protein
MTENADILPRPGMSQMFYSQASRGRRPATIRGAESSFEAGIYAPKDPWADIRGQGGNPFDAPMTERRVHPYMVQSDRYLSNVANSTMIPWHVISRGRVSRQPKEWDPYKWYIGENIPTNPPPFEAPKTENDPGYYWSNNSSDPNWSGPNPTNEWNIRNRKYLRCFSQSGGDYETCNAIFFGNRFPDSEMVAAQPTGFLWEGYGQ